MFLFFDCETNGLPKDYNASPRDVDNFPRVIQIAWMLTKENGVIIEQEKHLIKPNGWTIPKDKFWIENGYSTEENAEKGRPISDILHLFASAIVRSEIMVAHNMNFDHRVIGAEFVRLKKGVKKKPAKVCTMQKSIELLKLPDKYGRPGKYKFPKLEELHHFLFNEGFEGAHDALADVNACARCFFELVKRKVVILDHEKGNIQGRRTKAKKETKGEEKQTVINFED